MEVLWLGLRVVREEAVVGKVIGETVVGVGGNAADVRKEDGAVVACEGAVLSVCGYGRWKIRAGPMGIDVEKLRPVPHFEEIASRFFSPREAEALMALQNECRIEAFFACWIRK